MPPCTAAPIATQVRVHLAVGRLAEPLFQQAADQRRARAAADQHDLVDLPSGDPGIVQGPLHAIHRPVQQRANQPLVLRAADLVVEVQRHAVLLGDELLFDPGERMIRQLPSSPPPPPARRGARRQLAAQVDAVLLLKSSARQVEQQVVEVVAAELGVAVAGQHLEDAVLRPARWTRRTCRRRDRRRDMPAFGRWLRIVSRAPRPSAR